MRLPQGWKSWPRSSASTPTGHGHRKSAARRRQGGQRAPVYRLRSSSLSAGSASTAGGLARANLEAANLTGAPWPSEAEVPKAANETPTRAAGSRPILTRAMRQQTCYTLTGLPYLPSGICTGASSRHDMAGQQARLRDPCAVRRLVPW
jgi:hypothetical protein